MKLADDEGENDAEAEAVSVEVRLFRSRGLVLDPGAPVKEPSEVLLLGTEVKPVPILVNFEV